MGVKHIGIDLMRRKQKKQKTKADCIQWRRKTNRQHLLLFGFRTKEWFLRSVPRIANKAVQENKHYQTRVIDGGQEEEERENLYGRKTTFQVDGLLDFHLSDGSNF